MISAGEFRNGVTFEQDGQVLQVVEFQHETFFGVRKSWYLTIF